MINKAFIFVLGCVAVLAFSGCYTARTYVINKERVDQGIPGQAANTPVKTRKVVVFEVIEKDKAHPALAADGTAASSAVVSAPEKAGQNNFDLPQSSGSVEAPVAVTAAPQNYVVEKDDTLQKISKKVYGSYSKWTKIYDANRDVIKDPNFLKAGITLKIPALEMQTTTENK
jgi:nucleoid-associated protein YgaU